MSFCQCVKVEGMERRKCIHETTEVLKSDLYVRFFLMQELRFLEWWNEGLHKYVLS